MYEIPFFLFLNYKLIVLLSLKISQISISHFDKEISNFIASSGNGSNNGSIDLVFDDVIFCDIISPDGSSDQRYLCLA